MLISKMDRLFHNNIEQSIIDKINDIAVWDINIINFIRHYDNPDMFYIDKTAGIMPKESLIDESGNVYLVENIAWYAFL